MARRKALDPVTRYATDVVAGRIVAGRLVRLACQRHLSDLQLAAARSLEWDSGQAQEAIDFFAEVLCLPEETDADDEAEDDDDHEPEAGTPFVLSPWQQFIVGSLMGWFAFRLNKRGVRRRVRRFRVAFIEGAKGCGKTPMCAGLLLYMLIADGERGAQMFCAAVTKDQAKLAFADCEKMVAASPHLKAMVDAKVNNLAILATKSFLRPISSEKRGLDGKRVHGAIIDEEHEHPNGFVYLKVRAGTKGRRNALIMIPTNSGFDTETICGRHHEYSRQVLQGILTNDAWFAYVCHLDSCEACYAKGKLQPADDCPHCDDWKTEGQHWLKPNPNLGVSLPWQYLREQVKEAVDIPSQRNMVRRLNFCQWTDQATLWITAEAWAACTSTNLTEDALTGRDCVLGIDLSDKIDLAAVVAAFPRLLIKTDVDASATAAGAEDVAAASRPQLTHAIDLLTFFFMPKKSIQRRAQEDGVPYPEWEKAKYLTATVGSDLVDHDAIVDFIVEKLSKRYRVRGIGVDASGAAAVITRLQRHFGEDKVIEVPQGFKSLSEPSKTFEALIVSGNLAHTGNPVMAMCVNNTGKEENHWREIRPLKNGGQRKRIDGAVATIDALKVLPIFPPTTKRTRGAARVWTPNGFRPANGGDQPSAS